MKQQQQRVPISRIRRMAASPPPPSTPAAAILNQNHLLEALRNLQAQTNALLAIVNDLRRDVRRSQFRRRPGTTNTLHHEHPLLSLPAEPKAFCPQEAPTTEEIRQLRLQRRRQRRATPAITPETTIPWEAGDVLAEAIPTEEPDADLPSDEDPATDDIPADERDADEAEEDNAPDEEDAAAEEETSAEDDHRENSRTARHRSPRSWTPGAYSIAGMVLSELEAAAPEPLSLETIVERIQHRFDTRLKPQSVRSTLYLLRRHQLASGSGQTWSATSASRP